MEEVRMNPFVVIKSEQEMRKMNDELGPRVMYSRIETPIGVLDGIIEPTPAWRKAVVFVSAPDVMALLNAHRSLPTVPTPEAKPESVTELPAQGSGMPSDADMLLYATPFFETEEEKNQQAAIDDAEENEK